MKCERAVDIMERIEKKIGERNRVLLALHPNLKSQDLINQAATHIDFIDQLRSMGLEYRGSSTSERGLLKWAFIDSWTSKARDEGIVSASLTVYYDFFGKSERSDKLLTGTYGVGGWGYAFFPGIENAADCININVTEGVPTLMIYEAEKLHLKLFGEQTGIVPYRKTNISLYHSHLLEFVRDTEEFFNKTGHPIL